MQHLNLDLLTPFTKINSKFITDLNVKCKILKLIGGNIRENLDNPVFGDMFLDITLKA